MQKGDGNEEHGREQKVQKGFTKHAFLFVALFFFFF